MKITVDSWCSWEIAENQPALCTHYYSGKLSKIRVDKPDLGSVPALQRRRLGSLARVVFHVLDQCARTGANEPVIFSSCMGEIQRTYGILQSMAAQEPVSPGAFSLSVHNAIAGQWSLIRGIEAPMLALSSPSNSPVPALLEAAGILKEGNYPSLNVVFYDERLPVFFSPFLEGPAAPIALAMHLVQENAAGAGSAMHLRLRRRAAGGKSLPANTPARLFDLLSGKLTQLAVEEPQCSWQLEVTA